MYTKNDEFAKPGAQIRPISAGLNYINSELL